MPLTLRAHSLSTWAFSKIFHRCNIFDLRKDDIRKINSSALSFLYADLLEKPQQLAALRRIQDGGLELCDVELRSLSFLIITFIQTSMSEKYNCNIYHQVLLRKYVFEENISP